MMEASRLLEARRRLVLFIVCRRMNAGIPNRILAQATPEDVRRAEELIERFGWNDLRRKP